MNIYFAAALQNVELTQIKKYQVIIKVLENYGDILTEKIGDANFQQGRKEAEISCEAIHNFDLKLISKADLVVAEITNPSLGVGYEIGISMSKDIPVFVIYNKKIKNISQISKIIRGIPGVTVIGYNSTNDLVRQLDIVLKVHVS